MPQELPYLPSYKNVVPLFEKIRAAKVPESFTQSFLKETLGLKSSSDRALITLLKSLGILDAAGKPTSRYSALKNERIAGIEIARGVREAYAPLFDANENAHELDSKDLKGLVAQVAGTDAGATSKIAGTFRSLLAVADFASDHQLKEEEEESESTELREDEEPPEVNKTMRDTGPESMLGSMRPEFHYNIQIHLPANGSEETYLHIFSALRKVFK